MHFVSWWKRILTWNVPTFTFCWLVWLLIVQMVQFTFCTLRRNKTHLKWQNLHTQKLVFLVMYHIWLCDFSTGQRYFTRCRLLTLFCDKSCSNCLLPSLVNNVSGKFSSGVQHVGQSAYILSLFLSFYQVLQFEPPKNANLSPYTARIFIKRQTLGNNKTTNWCSDTQNIQFVFYDAIWWNA